MRFLLYLFLAIAFSNPQIAKAQTLQRPKLVVGIVIDQMRWDYLYRYYDRYAANGGFKRMLNNGFACESTFIPYAPTVTAPGHASIYTGSVPAVHGITGNFWWDREQMRSVYCTEDNWHALVLFSTVVNNSTQDGEKPFYYICLHLRNR